MDSECNKYQKLNESISISYPALIVSHIQVSGKYFLTLILLISLLKDRGSPDNFRDANAFIETSESTSELNMIPGDAR